MQLKTAFIIIPFLCWHVGVLSQSVQLKNYIAEITGIIKNNSLVAREIDWLKYEKDIAILSKNLNSVDSCKPVHDFIIKTLRKNGDKHSFFIYKSVVKDLNNKSSKAPQSQAQLLNAHIGYIKVPEMMSFNAQVNNAFRDTIQQLIRTLDTQNYVIGWIVDLRHNTGGNMWPMLAGLNPLIKDGVAGYWVSPIGRKDKWFSSGRGMMGTGEFYKIKKLSSPIAVLIDSFTASSGEMTAISFLSLPNVKTFGQPSAGYTTANSTYPLLNGNILQLATSYAADRKGKVYKDKIIPDVLTDTTNPTHDYTIEAAKKWLSR